MKKKSFTPSLPSAIQLNILQYSGYCIKCDQYDDHKMEICSQCEDFLCKKNGDIIWLIGDSNYIICRNCILKRIDLFKNKNYHFTTKT